MNYYKYIVTLVFLCNVCLSLDAQELSKEDKIINKANFARSSGHMKEALDIINPLTTGDNPNPKALFVKTNWLIERHNYIDAIELAKKLDQVAPDFNPLQHKLLADCYFNTGSYDLAKTKYEQFLAIPNLKNENYQACRLYLKHIDFIQSQPKTALKLDFKNIGPAINTEWDEYFPSSSADERFLYFTRNTNSNEDIWVSEQVDGQWQSPNPVDQLKMEGDKIISINSYSNDGAHTISADGKHLLFTSCDRTKNIGSCDLYYSKKTGEEWGRARLLSDGVNSRSWDSQPCISADGKTIYFVSARSGGFGGTDIYKTTIKSNGEFTEPENLGDVINSEGNEDKPFIHPDGTTLYFSSDGHPGYGGKDLFMSKYENDHWTTPVNLGNQINSNGHEISIFVNAIGNRAYMAKQVMEEGRGDLDIFSFSMPKEYLPEPTTYIKGIVVNAKDQSPQKASIKVFNPKTQAILNNLSSDEKNGEFLVVLPMGQEYGFHVLKPGFALYSKNYNLEKTTNGTPKEIKIELQPLESGTKFALRNVFFETGKFNLKAESNLELDKLVDILNLNPTIQIEISGHTDNVGKETDNKLLSENRANSVKAYLVLKNISAERITTKGYGSSKPIASNDSADGKAQNRRTEVEVK
jgi:outer membrane protein OmpA-like peptidoglycan-associated protein/Tol biopolymer transport system component